MLLWLLVVGSALSMTGEESLHSFLHSLTCIITHKQPLADGVYDAIVMGTGLKVRLTFMSVLGLIICEQSVGLL
jgi:hypothetical protein